MKAAGTGAVMFLSLVMVLTTGAQDQPAPKAVAKNANFEKLKTLRGEWEIAHNPAGHGNQPGSLTYKVVAGGSAVQETIFGGTDHEMVTLFYQDGDALALTHYCMLGNRPMMREQKASNPNQIVFACQKEDNLKIENEDHMHQATFTFTDADHVKAEWVLYKGGKSAESHAFEFVRKKNSPGKAKAAPASGR